MAGSTRTKNATAQKQAIEKISTEQTASATPGMEVVEKNNDVPPKEDRRAYRVVDTLDPNMYVPVRNGFNGKLIYKSRKTGERYVWEHFGDEQDMELRELRAAKTSYKAFYENNWFLIDDPEVIEYLGVEKFYANALSYEEFDTLFSKTPEEIAEKVSRLSKGQKASLKYRAKQLIKDGGIDSRKVITTLEHALEVELIEK